jgi:anti-anti-sigma factor
VSTGTNAADQSERDLFPSGDDHQDFDVRPTLAGPRAALVIAVTGDLDYARLSKVRGVADLAIDAQRPVVLDLSDCPFIDSTGLGLVLEIQRELAGVAAERVAVVARPGPVTRAFSRAAVDRTVQVCATREEALELLASPGPAQ